MTPLSCALLHGNSETVGHILGKTFARLDGQDNMRRSYLHFALAKCAPDHICSTLLDRGAHPRVLDKKGRPALYYLMFAQVEENIRLRLYTTFMQQMDSDTRKYLLNLPCGAPGQTVLHRAVLRGDMHLVKRMLEEGAQLMPDAASLTPFHFAVAKGSRDICRILIANCPHEKIAGLDLRGRSVWKLPFLARKLSS